MTIARGELGVEELRGMQSSRRVLEYLSATGVPLALRESDSTPWCAAFVTWCLREASVANTGSAAARSYLRYGQERAIPVVGCIAVYSRGGKHTSQGHVGFWLRRELGRDYVLGGNQRDAVCERSYPVGRLLGYRWPTGYPLPAQSSG
jgi:uncharacterized protein (TIGR02594 family)